MANQTYQMVLTGICCGQFVQNVIHFRLDDDGFANRLLAAKGLIEGWIAAGKLDNWLDMLPAEYIYKSAKARRVTGGGGPEYVDVTQSGDNGTLGSNASVSGAGPVLLWFTDGGPKRVGKTFLAGIGADQQDGGEVSASALAAINSAATSFRASFATVGGTTPTAVMCIPRSNDPSVRSLIIDQKVSKDLGQQRRRHLPV